MLCCIKYLNMNLNPRFFLSCGWSYSIKSLNKIQNNHALFCITILCWKKYNLNFIGSEIGNVIMNMIYHINTYSSLKNINYLEKLISK